jgi:hypothetical protein
MAGCTPDGQGAPGTVEADCEVDADNALRLLCEVTARPAGPVSVEVTDPVDGAHRTFTSSAVEQSHAVPIWGLHAESDIQWTARANGASVSGTTLTGPVPANLGDPPEVEISEDGHLIRSLMVPRGCGGSSGLAIVDDEGRFVWYADLEIVAGVGTIIGFSLTTNGAIALLGRQTVIEVGFDGMIRQILHKGDQLDRFVHHDAIVSPDGFTYVLTADLDEDENGSPYVHDGVDVFGPDGARVTAWQLGPPFDPTVGFPPPIGYWAGEFGNARDVSHANGLWFVDSERILVSLRHASTVIAVDGLREDDGQIAWAVGAGKAIASDFDWPVGEGFEFQHNPVQLADGTFTVLDNGENPRDSRGVQFAIDESAGTVAEVASWSAERWCPVQGNASMLEDDHMLIGCAGTRQAIEVAPDGGIVWQLRNSCDATSDNGLVRALPVTLGDVSL